MKLAYPTELINNIAADGGKITVAVAKIASIKRFPLPEDMDDDYLYAEFDRVFEQYNFFCTGTLIDYYGADLVPVEELKDVSLPQSDNNAQQDCSGFKSSFSTYGEAIDYVRSAPFKIKKEVPLTSSWLQSAEFYGCREGEGYLIIVLKTGREYIHKGVPSEVWEAFINAPSAGSYYDSHIKGRFRLTLTN